MRRALDYIWPVVGLLAVAFSFWLLAEELRAISAEDVLDAMAAIGPWQLAAAAAATVAGYAMLAWYDRIALLHLGVTHISWTFITLASFTTYALSHNIGASVLSGAMVRYRAYSSRGLSTSQIAILVGLCSFTFVLGVVLLAGLVLVFEPYVLARLTGLLPGFMEIEALARGVGALLLCLVALYLVGSLMGLPPLRIRAFRLDYPRPAVTLRQLAASTLDLLFTAAIVYFLLPWDQNPGYFVVLAVFLASFSAALISHAPGGLGVFELVFVAAMPDIPDAELLAALVLFRVLYLLIPFAFSLVVVAIFERRKLAQALKERTRRIKKR
ncbi:lysylphosphatidylglycerol synthase domain-containing protein [Salinarimonas ramus]|uniref:Membrane protein n=1 Tax=Salinarimonas ramus TaxID=690164 RepID=A0A917Q5B6_9HYPH|nr:lysylphosphatidylglycerol synthase domain-containing protein [Salinarimonas ramus]GGK24529.1 membrane protein [Salinarimonas ramus]